jgi:hypothetical protein
MDGDDVGDLGLKITLIAYIEAERRGRSRRDALALALAVLDRLPDALPVAAAERRALLEAARVMLIREFDRLEASR